MRHFEADMHQREQEVTVVGKEPGSFKRVRHKRFNAIEVKLVDLRLRAILAVFNEPSKRLIGFGEVPEDDRYKDVKVDEGESEARATWFDFDDFVETDWTPPEPDPAMHITQIASCPRFTYFKRMSNHQAHPSDEHGLGSKKEESRFGNEDTHVCLMGKEPCEYFLPFPIILRSDLTSPYQPCIEISWLLLNSGFRSSCEICRACARSWTRKTVNLENGLTYVHLTPQGNILTAFLQKISDIERKIRQLERHAKQLHDGDEPNSQTDNSDEFANYLMPSDIICPSDWTDFENVYQAHCPKFR